MSSMALAISVVVPRQELPFSAGWECKRRGEPESMGMPSPGCLAFRSQKSQTYGLLVSGGAAIKYE